MRIRRTRKTPTYGLSDNDWYLLENAVKRCSRLSTHQLLGWSDGALNGMGKGFDDFREHGDPASLEDIRVGIIGLLAVVLELEAQRRESP